MPSFCVVGAKVLARTPADADATFEALIVALRPRYPRIHVRFLADHATGNTSALALPTPREAYLHAGLVRQLPVA